MKSKKEISDISFTTLKRDEFYSKHPVVQGDYTLRTPMLLAAYAIVRERVATRRTGIVFYGPPRIGKTKCAEEIKRLLTEEFRSLIASIIYARPSLRPSDSHMFRLILEARGHVLASRKDPNLLFKNAVTDVELEVKKQSGSQYILIIDEAHLLDQTDMQRLVVFHNALASRGVKMTTLSFAQPEIMYRRTALMAARHLQIIARFLSEPVRFEGCSCVEYLRALLRSFDQHSDYPEGSGWSYTRFFVPEAFLAGFRLEEFAQSIWEALQSASETPVDGGIPVEHVCLTVQYILFRAKFEDNPHYQLSTKEILNAVEESNLENFCNIMAKGGTT